MNVGEIERALGDALWPDGVSACAYRVFTDPAFGSAIDVQLILDADDWSDEVESLCGTASATATAVLAEFDAEVITSCRTREDVRELEGQPGEEDWTRIAGPACEPVPAVG